jgi:hypothetical protein
MLSQVIVMLPSPEFNVKELWQLEVQALVPGDPVLPALPLSFIIPAKNIVKINKLAVEIIIFDFNVDIRKENFV